MEIWLPASTALITQGFGANATTLYKDGGLKGHTGTDWGLKKGDAEVNLVDQAYCYSVMNKDNPDLTKYRAVFTLVEAKDGFVYEVSYGHCDQIYAEVGKTYKVGDLLATCGATGDVFKDGVAPTIEQRQQGVGAHLHFQVRKCRKVTFLDSNMQYLSDGFGILKKDGYYYEVVNYGNGYNGCVDATAFYLPYQAKDYSKVMGIYQMIVSILKAAISNLLAK